MGGAGAAADGQANVVHGLGTASAPVSWERAVGKPLTKSEWAREDVGKRDDGWLAARLKLLLRIRAGRDVTVSQHLCISSCLVFLISRFRMSV